MKCPSGKIMRKNGVCTKNTGKPGKGVRLFTLRKGGRSQFGYKNVAEKSELARHRALMRAIRAGEPVLGLFRRLNALMVLTKRTNPALSSIYKKDRDWVGALLRKARTAK